ncbi:MAG TPA: DUF4363 family protein [Anaerovoracaceae bacterium]|nr:DUF4363 family protein [Anaerovoracaceae bacterium]
MRSLIISFVVMALVVSGWGIFVNYSDKNIHRLMNVIEDDILVSVNAEDWEKASEQIDELSEKWDKQKKVFTFFFDTEDIRDTGFSISRAKNYIKAKNLSLAAGELNLTKEQLEFLHMNELITLDNIF